jgi:hypothetical protein
LGSSLGASAYTELAQDRCHVMVDCLFRQKEPFSDLGIAQALRDQFENLLLARGEA